MAGRKQKYRLADAYDPTPAHKSLNELADSSTRRWSVGGKGKKTKKKNSRTLIGTSASQPALSIPPSLAATVAAGTPTGVGAGAGAGAASDDDHTSPLAPRSRERATGGSKFFPFKVRKMGASTRRSSSKGDLDGAGGGSAAGKKKSKGSKGDRNGGGGGSSGGSSTSLLVPSPLREGRAMGPGGSVNRGRPRQRSVKKGKGSKSAPVTPQRPFLDEPESSPPTATRHTSLSPPMERGFNKRLRLDELGADEKKAVSLSDSEYTLECSLYASDPEARLKRSHSFAKGNFRGSGRLSQRRRKRHHDALDVPKSPNAGRHSASLDASHVAERAFRVHSLNSVVGASATILLSSFSDPGREPLSWRETIADKAVIKKLSDKDIKRQEMIYELIQTERGFYRHLLILKTLFKNEIVRHGLLNEEEVLTMFSNLEDIMEINGPICERLMQVHERYKGRAVERFGHVMYELFRDINPLDYAKFCGGQKKAVDLYHQKAKASPAFAELLREVEGRLECQRLKFGDFNAKVMQRLSKYPLLLEGILKSMPRMSVFKTESELLKKAIHRAKEFLQVVDAHIKEQQDWQRIIHIQQHLDFKHCIGQLRHLRHLDLTASPRKLIREGPLDLVLNHAPSKEIHVILLSDLILFVSQKDSSFVLKCPGLNIQRQSRSPVLLLRDTLVRPEATQKKGILLINKTDACMYQVRALSARMQKQWLQDFQTAQDALEKASRQGVMYRKSNKRPSNGHESQPGTPASGSGKRRPRTEAGEPQAPQGDPTRTVHLEKPAGHTGDYGLRLIAVLEANCLAVSAVKRPSIASEAGLKLGDLVIGIDGATVTSGDLTAAEQLIASKDRVDILVSAPAAAASIGASPLKGGLWDAQGNSRRRKSKKRNRRPVPPAPEEEDDESAAASAAAAAAPPASDGKSAATAVAVVEPADTPTAAKAATPAVAATTAGPELTVTPNKTPAANDKPTDKPKSPPASATPGANPFVDAAKALDAGPAPLTTPMLVEPDAASTPTSTSTPLKPDVAAVATAAAPGDSPGLAAPTPEDGPATSTPLPNHSPQDLREMDAMDSGMSPEQKHAVLKARRRARKASDSYLIAAAEQLVDAAGDTTPERPELADPFEPQEAEVQGGHARPADLRRESSALFADAEDSDDSAFGNGSFSRAWRSSFKREEHDDILMTIEESLTADDLHNLFSPHDKDTFVFDGPGAPGEESVHYAVLDIGSTLVRIGVAGSAAPAHVFRAVVGREKGSDKRLCGDDLLPIPGDIACLESIEDICFPVRDGILEHPLEFKELLVHILGKLMPPAPGRLCITLADSYSGDVRSMLEIRDAIAQVLFNLHPRIVGVMFGNKPYMACWGAARRCALVVHSGDSYTCVVPVVRSGSSPDMPETLLYACEMSGTAGSSVTSELERLLTESGQELVDEEGAPYPEAVRRTLVENVKETLAFVSQDFAADRQSSKQSKALEKPYTLPGGNVLLLSSQRFTCAEILFGGPGKSVQQLMVDSISKCPEPLRDELWSNVVLSGGNTRLRGFGDRLATELQTMGASQSLHFNSTPDQRNLPWIGAAHYSTLDNARERFITRELQAEKPVTSAFLPNLKGQDQMAPAVLALEMATSPYAFDLGNPFDESAVTRQAVAPRVRAHELRDKIAAHAESISRLTAEKLVMEAELEALMDENDMSAVSADEAFFQPSGDGPFVPDLFGSGGYGDSDLDDLSGSGAAHVYTSDASTPDSEEEFGFASDASDDYYDQDGPREGEVEEGGEGEGGASVSPDGPTPKTGGVGDDGSAPVDEKLIGDEVRGLVGAGGKRDGDEEGEKEGAESLDEDEAAELFSGDDEQGEEEEEEGEEGEEGDSLSDSDYEDPDEGETDDSGIDYDAELELIDDFLHVSESPVHTWTADEIEAWMTMVDLEQLLPTFLQNDIQGIDLLDLDDADLLSMNIRNRDLRLRCLKEAALLRAEPGADRPEEGAQDPSAKLRSQSNPVL